jgi:hypothetical protein
MFVLEGGVIKKLAKITGLPLARTKKLKSQILKSGKSPLIDSNWQD